MSSTYWDSILRPQLVSLKASVKHKEEIQRVIDAGDTSYDVIKPLMEEISMECMRSVDRRYAETNAMTQYRSYIKCMVDLYRSHISGKMWEPLSELIDTLSSKNASEAEHVALTIGTDFVLTTKALADLRETELLLGIACSKAIHLVQSGLDKVLELEDLYNHTELVSPGSLVNSGFSSAKTALLNSENTSDAINLVIPYLRTEIGVDAYVSTLSKLIELVRV